LRCLARRSRSPSQRPAAPASLPQRLGRRSALAALATFTAVSSHSFCPSHAALPLARVHV
jgi:hypothetical protein